MPEVLEIEQAEAEETKEIKQKWDSWVVEIPKEIIEAQGLNEGALVSLTCRNGRVEGEIINPSPELKEISRRLLEENRELYEELKRLGD
jgi:hypothetical protein